MLKYHIIKALQNQDIKIKYPELSTQNLSTKQST